MTPGHRAARARTLALEAGFDLAGVASASAPRELGFFPEWIARGYAGEMEYLTSQRDRRADVPGHLRQAQLDLGQLRVEPRPGGDHRPHQRRDRRAP